VGCGLILTNLFVDNVITPAIAKKTMDISFLEITLSLLLWGFLLGVPGAIVAIPLTLAIKELLGKTLKNAETVNEPSG
jgi:predicted PurR-regulated permease PerM